MDQETRKIVEKIEAERARFGRNLEELEYRVKQAASPRAWFEEKSGWILGSAAATGFLVALMLGTRHKLPNGFEGSF
jgi:hypothetical protein